MTSCSRHGFGRCIADVFRDLGGRYLRRKTLDRGPQIFLHALGPADPSVWPLPGCPGGFTWADVSFEADAREANPPIADLE